MKITSLPAFPQRSQTAHKGTFKTLYIVGGQSNMFGAPALTARGALRSGTGLVKFVADKSLLTNLLLLEPSATGIVLSDRILNLDRVMAENDPDERGVLAVGPGMGKSSVAKARVLSLLSTHRAMVLDADALNLLAESGKKLEPSAKPRILTPHPGEYQRLARSLNIQLDPVKTKHRVNAATALAKHHHAVVVLKGHQTVVASGTQCYVNQTGNPVLATAGSGDVLCGLIASLLAQGLGGFDAAVLGVYLHGLAADLWVKQNSPVGLLARELADMLPAAIRKWIKSCR